MSQPYYIWSLHYYLESDRYTDLSFIWVRSLYSPFNYCTAHRKHRLPFLDRFARNKAKSSSFRNASTALAFFYLISWITWFLLFYNKALSTKLTIFYTIFYSSIIWSSLSFTDYKYISLWILRFKWSIFYWTGLFYFSSSVHSTLFTKYLKVSLSSNYRSMLIVNYSISAYATAILNFFP